jgi:hypothetical protein
LWGDEPPPPTADPVRRQLTFQSRGLFTSRHCMLGQGQSLDHEGVAPLALSLEVRPVTVPH